MDTPAPPSRLCPGCAQRSGLDQVRPLTPALAPEYMAIPKFLHRIDFSKILSIIATALKLGRQLGIGYDRSHKTFQPSSPIISLVMRVLVKSLFFGPSSANIGPRVLGVVLKDAQ